MIKGAEDKYGDWIVTFDNELFMFLFTDWRCEASIVDYNLKFNNLLAYLEKKVGQLLKILKVSQLVFVALEQF